MAMNGRRATTVALAAAAAAVMVVTGCGSSSQGSSGGALAGTTASASCKGTPIKLMTIQSRTGAVVNGPDVPIGAQAAAAAVTKSCELGRPVTIVQCDDKYNPNSAAACGREAVAEKVTAIVGTTSAFASSFMPITTAAGIPDVGDTAAAQVQLTSPYAFPLQNAVTLVAAQAAAAKALGATKLVVVAINVPAIQPILAIAKASVAKLGMTYGDPILVPPTTTDLTQIAAQAGSSGADSIIPILPDTLSDQLIKALVQSGTDFHKTHVIVGGTVFGPQQAKSFGSDVDGLTVLSAAWPSSDFSNAGIKQFNAELTAIGQGKITTTVSSVVAWSSVHIIADLLKGSTTFDGKTLFAKLNASGPMTRPELAPFNFTTNAFPGDPIFGKLRAFSKEAVVSTVNDGQIKPISKGYVDYTKPFTLSSS